MRSYVVHKHKKNMAQNHNLQNNQRYVGVLEPLISHGIRGWVIDLNNLNANLEIVLRFDESYSVLVKADIFRKNLWRGLEGRYGFELRLGDIPKSILSMPPKKIHASLLCNHFECLNSPIRFDRLEIARSLCNLVENDLESTFN